MPNLFERCYEKRQALRDIETELERGFLGIAKRTTYGVRSPLSITLNRYYSYGSRVIPGAWDYAHETIWDKGELIERTDVEINKAKIKLIDAIGCVPDGLVFDITRKNYGFVMILPGLGLFGESLKEQIPWVTALQAQTRRYECVGILAPPVRYMIRGQRL